MSTENDKKAMQPHHEQQSLCTTRLPYRQGRKLTAVKVYTINNESNHLLIFGVPSLNLRQEIKSIFFKFGKLLKFSVTEDYPAEQFSENFHAVYERIQSARIAKRMLDTKNFYGGSLHVCYAPELETVDETRRKLLQRQRDVTYRLINLQKDNVQPANKSPEGLEQVMDTTVDVKKLNMGEINIIQDGIQVKDSFKNKRKNKQEFVIEKKFKPCFVPNEAIKNSTKTDKSDYNVNRIENSDITNEDIEVIDFTSTAKDTISNINEALNYKTFGNEVIRKIPEKPLNKIIFNVFNKKP